MTEPGRDARVADLIAARRAGASRGIERVETDEPAPLSNIQLALFTMDALSGSGGRANRPVALRLTGPLDHAALQAALSALVERHEPFRTIYPFVGAEPVQQVLPPFDVDLPVVDLADLDPVARRTRLGRILAEAEAIEHDPTSDVQFDARLVVEAADVHTLVLGLHHIGFDGWSEPVLVADLTELYRAAATGTDPVLPELPIRVTDYARWERAEAKAADHARDAAYWRERLAGLGHAPNLPSSPNAPVEPYAPVVAAFDAELMGAVHQLAREEKTTPFVVLVTALELLARELLDADDFVVSCPIAGRDRPEVQHLVGCFINTVLLRSSLREADTHRDLLRAVRANVGEALAHRSVPNQTVTESFGGWTRRPRLFRMSFQWRDFPKREPAGPVDVEVEVVSVPSEVGGLAWYVSPSGGGADIEVNYNPARFDPADVAHWVDRLRHHVRAVCADPSGSIGPGRPRRIDAGPTAPLEVDRIEAVTANIARRARLAPTAPAVERADVTIDYATLWERAGIVAAALVERGVEPGARVAILAEPGPGHVVSLLGVFRAGGVAVAIDAGLPGNRQALMASSAAARHAITVGAASAAAIASIEATAIVAVDPLGVIGTDAPEPLGRETIGPADDAAYVCFTSGTTGTPKGILGTHHGLAHFLSWERSRLAVTVDDRVGASTGISFDVNLREVLLPLTAGATLVFPEAGLLPDRILGAWADHAVTIVHTTPSKARAWMSEAPADAAVPELRWAVFAGEPLTGELVDTWRAIAPNGRVLNLYGPTETGLAKTAYEIGPEPERGVQPVGYPLPHTQVLIIDPDSGAQCDPGVTGEITIRTAIGTAGYLDAALPGFVANPLGADGTDVVYRTGDLGAVDEAGVVRIAGRLDDQLKIDGVRVEPAEAAALLERHPAVDRCAVLPFADPEPRLEAFLVAAAGAPPTAAELRAHLRAWLPTAGIPGRFTMVADLPLTSNGKVDRDALAENQPAPADPGPSVATPVAVADVVTRTWAEVLGASLPADADFFANGGTSLRALRILARLEAETGLTGPVDLFFDHPTLDRFAVAFCELVGRDADSSAASDADPTVTSFPLSYLQESMWFETWMRPDAQAYLIDRVLDIRGSLDLDAFGKAVATVVERHDILRSRFVLEAGEPRRVVVAGAPLPLVVVSDADADDPEAVADARVAAERERPFDLAEESGLRLLLIELGPDRHRLFMGQHHIITDGWSMRLLWQEIGAAYDALCAGRTPELEPLEATFDDYVSRQRDLDRSGGFDAGMKHWSRALREPLPRIEHPGDDRPAARVASRRYEFDVDPALMARVGAAANDLRCTPFMLALSLWGSFLARKAREDEILIGVPIADRGWAPTVPLLGVFLNTIVVRLGIGSDDTLESVATRARGTVLESFSHAQVPYERVIETVSGDRHREGTPLFQVLFQYHHDEALLRSELELSGLDVRRVGGESTGPPVDFYMALNHSDDRTIGFLAHDPRLIDLTEAESMVDEFLAFMAAALDDVAAPLPPVAPFALPDAPEVRQLSYAQESMWVAEQAHASSPRYSIARAKRIVGAFDADRFAEAIESVVARHDVLRSRVPSAQGVPELIIDPPGRQVVWRHDLRHHADEARAHELRVLSEELVETPFDLAAGPLVRIHLVHVTADEWVLISMFHHLVIDGESFPIFYREVSGAYRALLAGGSPHPDELDHQYPDYADHERELLDSGAAEPHLAHWRSVLAEPLPPTDLGRPQPGASADDAVLVHHPLPIELPEQLVAVATDLRITPYMLGLGIAAAATAILTEHDEALVATVVADRSWRPGRDLIGPFVNTVPTRILVGANATLATLAPVVRTAVLSGYTHASVPSEVILRQGTRMGAQGGLGAIEFDLIEGAESSLDLGPDVVAEPFAVPRGGLKFDLSIAIVLTAGHPSVRVEGRADRFSRADIERVASLVEAELEAALADPVGHVLTAESAPPVDLVPARARASWQDQPDRVVIEDADRTVQAVEFAGMVERFAAQLAAAGVEPGARVLLDAHRAPETIALMYAVWHLGAAYVPVDLDAPAARNAAIAADCGASVFATVRPTARLEGAPATVVVDASVASPTPGPAAPAPGRAAYIIYTSGSTGRPKGVEVSHRALASYADAAADAYGMRADDRVLQFHSLAFDASVEETHVPMAIGATVVLRTDALLGSARRFMEFVEQRATSVVSIPTALWHEMVPQLHASGHPIPAGLRVLVIGGEAARSSIADRWFELDGRPVLVNSYGPTEATVVALTAEVRPPVGDGPMSIGRPVRGMRAEVLAPDGRSVPPGEWGELALSGPQLATGYINRPEETAAVFTTLDDGHRWYRTGDRARRRSDGEFEVAGRLDDQVKIAGHRIELGEVEAALVDIDAVTEAAVLVVEADADPQIEAYVVASGETAATVRAALSDAIPAAMVPAAITLVDELPRSVSGKVDRQQLRSPQLPTTTPVPSVSVPSSSPSASAPAGGTDGSDAAGEATMQRLAAVWAELLGTDSLGADADFFELGGRSLTAVRLAYLIEETFGVSVAVAQIFEEPTLGQVAAAVDAELGGTAAPPVPAIEPPAVADPAPAPVAVAPPPVEPPPVAPPTPPVVDTAPAHDRALDSWPRSPVRLHLDRAPLSLAQQRLWLHGLLRPEALPYLLHSEYRIRGPVDVATLDDALRSLVSRHEILRTRIVVDDDGHPVQAIDPAPASTTAILARDDVSAVDPVQRRDQAAALAAEFCVRPIDLATEHPFRAHLTRLSAIEHHLSLVFHHVAVDARGEQLLREELSMLYAFHSGVADEPAPPALQFADFAVWQRARLRDGSHDESLGYWRDLLGTAPQVIEVPGRRADVAPGAGIERHPLDMPSATSDELMALAAETGVSPFQVMVALTTALFHRLTGDRQVIVGSPGSERSTPALDDISGLFVNTLIVAAEIEPTTTFRDLLRLVRSRTGAALEHGSVPFEAILDRVRVERDADRVPLVNVMCQFIDRTGREDLTLAGLDLERVRRDLGAAGTVADLMVTGEVSTEGRLTMALKHDTGILDGWVIAELARSLDHIARIAASAPDTAIRDLPIVSPEEADWLVEGLNDNDRPFPETERVDDAFLTAARETPTAIAVGDGRRELTYAALEFEAEALADTLRAHGVSAGDLVAVELDRSIELVVALVAVLRTGAAYVPIDRALPPARRDQVLDLAGVAASITARDGAFEIDTQTRPAATLPEGDGAPPAYVMFTSGSTGVPKGVVVSHRAIQRTVRNVDYAPLAPATVLGMASNPAFDALTFEVWGALLNGARIEIIDTDTLADPEAFAATLRSRRINTMFLTSSLCTLVVAAVPDAFAQMHTLMVGGEAVDVATMRRLLETGPRRLVNGYGPTECTTFSVWYHIRAVADDARSVPIGGPTRNTRLYVLDVEGRLVPRGVPGELCIAGPGLAHGYLGDAELTAAKFVEVDIAGTPTRVYRTGDLVRRRSDGVIDYLGRLDHQVKLRGFRIELSEIEAALAADSSVEAAVVKVTGEGAARRLVGFVTPSATTDSALDPDALRGALGSVLPTYMVPARIVVLDTMPLTPSGKADRRALQEPALELTGPSVAAASPLVGDEQTMVGIWSEVLSTPVGPDDDFFDAGGNSLLAVELLTRVEREFGVRLPLSSLFDERTARTLLRAVAAEAVPTPSASRYLVTLREGDPAHATPLWLVHPAGGSLILYEPMVSHFKADRLVVGVEARGLSGDEEPLDDVQAIADHQVRTIRSFQPHGPYRIIGYSVGGIVALEVARRLVDAGETVELLAAIEAGIPRGPSESVSRGRKYAGLLRKRDFRGMAATALAAVRERVSDTITHVSERGTIAETHRRVLQANADAFDAYEPRPLDIPITLLFGDQTTEQAVARLRRRWSALATGGTQVFEVSGSHDNDAVLRDPHAKILAIAIEDLLDECDRAR